MMGAVATFIIAALIASAPFTVKNTAFELKWDKKEREILSFDCAKNVRCRDIASFLQGASPEQINGFVNRYIRYTPEKGDRWSIVEEVLSSQSGDCEEYVFMKLLLLSVLGFDKNEITIHVMGRGGTEHLSLTYDGKFLDMQDVSGFEDYFFLTVGQSGISFWPETVTGK